MYSAPTFALIALFAAEPFSESMPWIQDPGDDLGLTPMERLYGEDPATMDVPIESFWQGNQLYTRDSYAKDIFFQAGMEPIPAMSYDPSPGILYIEMNGVTLTPNCGNGDVANAALNCSPLVDGETSFPPYGSADQQASMFQTLQNYYGDFNLVMSTSRPPEWVPYTMAVIGGTAGNAGQPGGTCGVANVACDGLKRNHVSLSFPQSCPGNVAEIAAQETAHNWGLEHTNNSNDLMYPFVTGGGAFLDQCMAISHATGDGITQCGYIHELYCGEEQQNSYEELMGVFGPREADNVPPEIVSVFPEDGAVFATTDTFDVTGMVSENSNFIAAKWTLEGGEEGPFTRCTNNVCDQDFNLGVGFNPNDTPLDFVALVQPPVGEYTATFEVMDAYGGYDMRVVTFHVTEDGETGPPPDTDSDTATGTGTGSDSDSDSDSDDEGDEDDDGDEDDGDSDTDGTGIDQPAPRDCACRTPAPDGPMVLLFAGLGLAFLPRRRQS